MEQKAKSRLPCGTVGRNFENSRESAESGCPPETIFDQHQEIKKSMVAEIASFKIDRTALLTRKTAEKLYTKLRKG